MSAPVISLDRVSRRFGDVAALDEVSLELREGEFFALLGPSGCGKTTLLRIIAGFETPDAGRVLLDGRDITGLRANARPVNLMFQSYALFPHMSVRANISYGLEMERLARPTIAARVDEVLEMAELAGLAARRPDQLSGGQRQRVALARALVKRPRVLLLDEPLGALDKALKEQMQFEIKRLQHEVGITFVMVTHDQEEALVMADRIALMLDGRIEQLGDPRALYEAPASRFVAGFIGVSNFIDGAVAARGLTTQGHGTLSAAVPDGLCAGAEASLAVRPERIVLVSGQRPRSGNSVAGRVADIAYHGRDITVHVAVAGIAAHLVVRLTAGAAQAARIAPGGEVWCNWKREHGRLLAR
jgi:spermidine/putrescine ABC transporter ATP-binding subunit